MKVKTSLVSQALELILISLIFAILFILTFIYGFNPFELSLSSLFWYVLLFIGLVIINEVIVRRLYAYEVEKAGIKETFIFFHKKETFIPYSNITRIEMKKSFFGRILNYGDIEIWAPPSTKMVLRGIRNPETIHKRIKEMIERNKKDREENE